MLQQAPYPIAWQKRTFDIVLGTILFIITSPLFVLFMVLIFIEHALRGHPFDPLFYSEERVSRGAVFRLYKFNIFNQRTIDAMRSRGEFIHTKHLEYGGQLIFIGVVLKQIYLDELPQLINVLRGDMSLVGPRPLNLEVYAKLKKAGVPAIALVLGGMTGNFQSYKNTRGQTASELDAHYLDRCRKGGWSLVRADVRIILRTIKVLLRAQGV